MWDPIVSLILNALYEAMGYVCKKAYSGVLDIIKQELTIEELKRKLENGDIKI